MESRANSMSPRRQWFQFRLSTLLLLLVVCAVALGWWRDRAGLNLKLQQAHRERAKLSLEAAVQRHELFRDREAAEREIQRLSARRKE